MKRISLAVILALTATGATPQVDKAVQGFVSAELLSQWCDSSEPLDNEACLSYLRGAFDVLQVVRHIEHRGLVEREDGADTICISALAPVTQLKLAANRYARKNPQKLNTHGGVFVMQMFRDTYPC